MFWCLGLTPWKTKLTWGRGGVVRCLVRRHVQDAVVFSFESFVVPAMCGAILGIMIFSFFQRSAVEQYHAATQTNWIVEEWQWSDDHGYGEQWKWESDWERPGVYRGPACILEVTQHEVRWPSADVFSSTSKSRSKIKGTK